MGRAHDTAPVLVPIISTVDAVSGLVIASGFSGHGVGIGPGSGLLTSQLATGETPCVDCSPYRLARFSDGSVIRRPELPDAGAGHRQRSPPR